MIFHTKNKKIVQLDLNFYSIKLKSVMIKIDWAQN